MTADGDNSPSASDARRRPGRSALRRHRLRRRSALGAIASTGVAVWAYARWAHVTENDARVRADMITIAAGSTAG